MGGQSSKVPQTFADTCHACLRTAKIIDEKLYVQVYKSPLSTAWRNTVSPILNRKLYLFLPLSIEQSTPTINSIGCGQDFSFQNSGQYHIYYDCYIYNLRQQLIVRKQTGHFFIERQVWKIFRKCSKALYQWRSEYPNKKIGKISPINMIMNKKGNIRLVNKLSFAVDPSVSQIQDYQNIYTRNSQMYVKLQNQKPGQSQKELAIALLQIVTMEQSPQSSLQIQQKIFLLRQAINYSHTLKNLILALLQKPPNQKPSLNEIMQIAKKQEQRLKKSPDSEIFH